MAYEPVRRPRNRKGVIIGAAADLFRVRGYHNVALSDVADAVGVTAPALYRHVRNKQDLLLVTVTSEVDALEQRVSAATDLEEAVSAMASAVAERRGLAALWQREARHLPPAERDALRAQVTGISAHIAKTLRAERSDISTADAELLAWGVLSVLASLSARRVTLSGPKLETAARHLAYAVVRCAFSSPSRAFAAPAAVGEAGPVSRREQLLSAAAKLFDERGFQSVSMSDIGTAVGIAGPSIYKHFPSKGDILVAVMIRGNERMRAGVAAARAASDPRQALAILVQSHIQFSIEHSHLIGLLISERSELPEKERAGTYRAQRDYLDLWVGVVDSAYPRRSRAETKLLVSSVFTVINNLVRTGRLAARPDLADRLINLADALLSSQSNRPDLAG